MALRPIWSPPRLACRALPTKTTSPEANAPWLAHFGFAPKTNAASHATQTRPPVGWRLVQTESNSIVGEEIQYSKDSIDEARGVG